MQKFDTEAFANAGKNAAADIAAVALTSFAGFEKLAELNLATARSVLESSLDSIQAMAAATTPEGVLAVQTQLAQPLADKAAAYSRRVQEITAQTGVELAKVSKSKLADAQKIWGSAVESITQNAPAGSEAFLALFKGAAAAGEQEQAFARAQDQVTDVVAKTVKVAKPAAQV